MRKLAWVCGAFSAAVFAAHYLIPGGLVLYLAAALVVCAAVARLFDSALRRRVLPALLAAAVALAAYYVQTTLVLERAEALAGQDITITARITEFPRVYDDYTSVSVSYTGEDIPHLAARIYDYDNNLPENLSPGDIIEIPLRLRSAAARYGESSDYYPSRSVYSPAYTRGEGRIIGRSELAWIYFPQHIARSVTAAVDAAFPADTAVFIKALLMGDKDALYDTSAYVSLRTSGLIHVVAVSGLHVSFLVGLLQMLLGRSRRCSFLCLILVWLFVLMTGAPPSAVRAGFMQSMLLIAPVVRREGDDVTSLTLALALILIANPAQAGNAGVQLSFSAMAGIFLVAPRIYARFTLPRGGLVSRARRYFAAGISSSVGAAVFTTPILALNFGYFPLYGVLTNLLCLWAVTVCFALGFLVCALAVISVPLAAFAAHVPSILARYIIAVSGFVSRLPFSSVYTSNGYLAGWLFTAYAVFAVYLIPARGRRINLILPTALSVITLCAALIITAAVYTSGAGYITAVDVGQGQSIAVLSGSATVVIDCGGGATGDNAGERTADILLGRARRRVDALILTHLHSDHANGVVRLMRMMPVDTLVLPFGVPDSDNELSAILEQAEQSGTRVEYISADTVLTAGNIEINVFAPPAAGDENERCMPMCVTVGEYDMLVTGDMGRTAERELAKTHDLSGIELYVAGHHGSKYSSSTALLEAMTPKTAVISVGYNNYGHPTAAALERIAASGVESIYRTDLNGSITVRIS